MVYCISDIHGEWDRFQQMLEQISFSPEDQLYVLGDAIDRGPNSMQVLHFIMDAPNITMLMGNHEEMCFNALQPGCDRMTQRLWKRNGGTANFVELSVLRPPEERDAILSFLASLPDCLDLSVNGRLFHLVHAMPGESHYTRIWGRPEYDYVAPWKDRLCILGHTPTCFLTFNEFEPFRIFHGQGFLDIDCGCGSHSPYRRLACLRLNDMKEFYV